MSREGIPEPALGATMSYRQGGPDLSIHPEFLVCIHILRNTALPGARGVQSRMPEGARDIELEHV